MKKVDYERKMTSLAARGNEGRPLRTGPGCLVCRWWKKPCVTCQKNANGTNADGLRKEARLDLDDLLKREAGRKAGAPRSH